MQQQPQWGQPQWGSEEQPQTATNTYQPPPPPVTTPPAQSEGTVGRQAVPEPLGGAAPAEKQAAPMPPTPTPTAPLSPDGDVHAEVMLQVQNITVNEVHNGVQKNMVNGAELIVLELRPSPEELDAACQNLQLPPGTLSRTDGKPLLFAIAGDYKVPITQQVPVVKETPFSFIFAIPNLFVEFVFPQTGAEDELDAFDMLIRNYGTMRDSLSEATAPAQSRAAATSGAALAQQAPQEQKLSTKIAGGIGVASIFAVKGIKKATGLVSGAIGMGTEKIVAHTTPAEKPVQVPSEVKEHVKSLRGMTQGAVMVSSGLAASLVGVTAVIGQGIGAQIAKRHPTTSDPKYDGIKEVAGAAVGGVGLVFVAATDAARQVLTSSCDGVSTVVTHKLGAEAGEATQEGLGVVQDVVKVQQNMKQVGVKAILKKTGKQAASQYIAEMDAMEQEQTGGGGSSNPPAIASAPAPAPAPAPATAPAPAPVAPQQ